MTLAAATTMCLCSQSRKKEEVVFLFLFFTALAALHGDCQTLLVGAHTGDLSSLVIVGICHAYHGIHVLN